METRTTTDTINIRPGVSILSVLPYLNYKPWYAISEFVDNSLQSFLAHRSALERVEGGGFRLRVSIEHDPTDGRRITIRDNAAGIHEDDYERAFRTAEVPPDRSGLCEFGMGMKSAACWFGDVWSVRTTALGEGIERTVRFDIRQIVRDAQEELTVTSRPVPATAHYTEIILTHLRNAPQGRTLGKIKDHLRSIYRCFIREGLLELRFDGEVLRHTEPAVLCVPYFKEPGTPPIRWRKEIDLDFGLGMRAWGFAALREVGSTSGAGFALFRRSRLIQGSGDEGYRPEAIFGKSNSYTYQRLFGELHLEGLDVSHTKDGFRWGEHEDTFLALLKDELDSRPVPLLDQAEGYRARLKPDDLKSGAEAATARTADTIQREAVSALERELVRPIEDNLPPANLPTSGIAARRIVELDVHHVRWQVILELSDDPAVGDWMSIFRQPDLKSVDSGATVRKIGIRVALQHPFMQRFGGPEAAQIEPLLRIAVAIALGEVTAREGGARQAGMVRHNVNELLRDVLSKP